MGSSWRLIVGPCKTVTIPSNKSTTADYCCEYQPFSMSKLHAFLDWTSQTGIAWFTLVKRNNLENLQETSGNCIWISWACWCSLIYFIILMSSHYTFVTRVWWNTLKLIGSKRPRSPKAESNAALPKKAWLLIALKNDLCTASMEIHSAFTWLEPVWVTAWRKSQNIRELCWALRLVEIFKPAVLKFAGLQNLAMQVRAQHGGWIGQSKLAVVNKAVYIMM